MNTFTCPKCAGAVEIEVPDPRPKVPVETTVRCESGHDLYFLVVGDRTSLSEHTIYEPEGAEVLIGILPEWVPPSVIAGIRRRAKTVKVIEATTILAKRIACLDCGARLNAVASVGGISSPSAGSAVVCGHCEGIAVYDDQGDGLCLRRPTDEEQESLQKALEEQKDDIRTRVQEVRDAAAVVDSLARDEVMN